MKSNYFGFLAENHRFLAFGFLMAICSSYGQTFFISVFGGEIRAEFGLTHGAFGLIYSIATLVSGFCMIWAGSQIDRLDLRNFSFIICIGLAAASVLTGWTNSALMLGIAIFALRLFGQGLMSHAALTAMARYFDRDRGKAISIANLGFPTGQAIFPVIGVLLAGFIGWRNTWFVLASVLAALLTPMLLWLLKGHGERHTDMLARSETDNRNGDRPAQRQWTSRQVRRDPRFWLVIPATLSLSFIGTGIIFHQVYLVEYKGWSLAWFAANYTSLAVTSVMTTLVIGPMVDRVSAQRLMPYYLMPSIISLTVLASGTGLWLVTAFMLFQGVSFGMSRVVLGALWAEWYGVRHLGAIRALVAALMVIASAASPVLFGWMIDHGITIDAILMMSTAYLVVSIAMIVIAGRLKTEPD
jgi:sugar phosphate permease